MKHPFLLVAALIYTSLAFGQNTFKAILRNDKTKQALPGASAFVISLNKGATADSTGRISIPNLPDGKIQVRFSFVGYISQTKTISLPLQKNEKPLEIGLEPQSAELAGIVVHSTRTNGDLRDIPTRIEALPLEELDEKSTMRPGDIKMLLMESTGIAIQPTSAVSGSANIRIQGLDSRYTQLLKDGMPMYQGFSGGLSLLQISPLDLKQVEFIKGSASTLYGGGAIAGLVNLIGKTPTEQPELTFLLNGTSAKGLDASGYYAQKWKHVGTTLFGAYNYNGAYDPSTTGFSAIPNTKRFTFSPKVFLYLDDKNSGWFGINAGYENRYGGDMQVLNSDADKDHQYFERNKTFRSSTQLSFTHKINERSWINLKNTFGYFDRKLQVTLFDFSGKQFSSFTEINYVHKGLLSDWVLGANLTSDRFTSPTPFDRFNYSTTTSGVFGQNTYKVSKLLSIESGLRIDHNKPSANNGVNRFFILPRVNALLKIDEHLTSRIGGGLGYKMPSLFNDQSEREGYQNIAIFNPNSLKAERSYGGNGDINYQGAIGDAFININQLFFYTYVNNPLLIQNQSFVNAQGHISSQGAETNIKLSMDELAFYVGYTYTSTKQYFNGETSTQPLTPKNRFSFDATYEIENSFRAGAESFYTGPQLLSDGTMGKAYITFGLLLQKMWKHLDVYVNAENLSDRRQARWGSLYDGNQANPSFKDIYAPLDGIVVNAGIRIKLLTGKH